MRPGSPSACPGRPRAATAALLGVLLAATAAVYARTAFFAFIEGDDAAMITGHPVISQGLSLRGVCWSLTHGLYGIWMPATALTHMADISLFGQWAGGHHLTSVFWHGLAVLAFYAALRFMTGARGPSLLAAALFALHPLRVEDVAWISSRKDLVCGTFAALTLLAHAWYARRPSMLRYLALFAAFLLALAGKTSAAPLPAILLLLDAWPLARLRGNAAAAPAARRALWLVAEKIPFALLAAVALAVTWHAQREVGAVIETGAPPPLLRVAAVGERYLHYLLSFLWPFGLSSNYPAAPFAPAKAAAAWALIAILSLAALVPRRRCPWLAVGWFWFLAALVPVVGLLPYGSVPYADRYMYLPGMGLSLAAAWTLAEVPLARTARILLCGGLSALLAGLSWVQVSAWRDTRSLIERKMGVFPDDAPTFSTAGNWFLARGDLEQAIRCYRETVRIAPDSPDYCYNLGAALLEKDAAEAAKWLEKATQRNPGDGAAWTNLGCALLNQNRPQDALAPLREGVRLQPRDANAHVNLGLALLRCGARGEARAVFLRALQLDPQNTAAQTNLQLLR